MATWPTSLPQVLQRASSSGTHLANRIDFDPELGPPMSRRRGSSAPRQWSGSISVSQAQYATFLSFYQTDINYGADVFTWEDPVTGAAATCKLDAEPAYRALGAGFWQIDLSILVLP